MPVVAGVIVDRVQRITGGQRATDQIGRNDQRPHDGCRGDGLRPLPARLDATINDQPGERWQDKRECRDPRETGEPGGDANQDAVFERWNALTSHERPRGKCHHRHEHVVPPTVDRPGNQLVFDRDDERQHQARGARQQGRAQQVGGDDRQDRSGHRREAHRDVLVGQKPEVGTSHCQEDRFTHVGLIEAAHLARILDVVDRIAADVWMIDAIPAIWGRMQPLTDRGEILSQYLRPQRVIERAIPLHEHIQAKENTVDCDESEQDCGNRWPESPEHVPMVSQRTSWKESGQASNSRRSAGQP